MKKGILFGIIWLVIINAFGLLALNRFNLNPDTTYNWINQNDFKQEKTWNPIALHNHWDSYWFLSIAKDGYKYTPGELSNVTFFPLFPLLVKIFSIVFRNLEFTGWLLSSIFLLLACGVLYKLVQRYHPDASGAKTLLYLLIFPTAFFLNGIYAESLFLLLSAVFFYCLFEKNFWIAGVFGLLASLTRITGIFLFIPFIFEMWLLFRKKEISIKHFAPTLLIPLGTFSFFMFNLAKFGDFFAYFKTQASWGRSFAFNPDHFFWGTNASITNLSLDILFFVIGITASIFVFIKLRKSYGLYMLALIIASIATGTLLSIGRIILVLFPMYILLSKVKNDYGKFAITIFSTLLFALYTILFVNNYWGG